MINNFVDRIFCTDGSCSGNPGPGASAVIEFDNETGKKILYYDICPCDNSTNNREELKAIIRVFSHFANDTEKIAIYTDSQYCYKLFNEWIWNWFRNDWRKSSGKEIENLDLVKEAFEYLKKYGNNVTVLKVKGHSGNVHNEIADAVVTYNKTKFITLCRKHNIDFD